ncbi:hypothetical protein ACFVZH_07860 [Streptomyces sp. NPDC059534]|uniref:hypothetical protein n=1 Tax=Streptomyces sp. NPDC059534 TaxID=3346859 RepID=UPI0036AB5560
MGIQTAARTTGGCTTVAALDLMTGRELWRTRRTPADLLVRDNLVGVVRWSRGVRPFSAYERG